jgi:hypothetical protein
MVLKPTVLPVWADLDQVDPISLQNNVLTPPPEYQQYGWTLKQFPPRNWFNWLGRYTYRWLAYLSQQDAQGNTVSASNAVPTDVIFDSVNGGLAYIYVVDTGNAAAVYHGMVYLPPASVGATFVDIKKVTINTPSISASGTVTISGGTGPYIVYGQMKTIPS